MIKEQTVKISCSNGVFMTNNTEKSFFRIVLNVAVGAMLIGGGIWAFQGGGDFGCRAIKSLFAAREKFFSSITVSTYSNCFRSIFTFLPINSFSIIQQKRPCFNRR